MAVVDIEIIEDDDVAGIEDRSELGFDVSLKRRSVHGAADDPWRDDPVAAQPGDEGLRMPFAEGRLRLEPLSPKRAPAKAAHIRLHRCFIDKDKSSGFAAHGRLAIAAPFKTRRLDVRAFLFRRPPRFFYR